MIIAESEDDLNSFFKASFIIIKKIIYLISLLFFFSLIVLLIKSEIKFIVLLFSTYISSIFTGFTSIIFSLQNIKRERKIVAKFQIFEAIIKLTLVYVLFVFIDKSANTVAVGVAISSLLVFVLQMFLLKKCHFL